MTHDNSTHERSDDRASSEGNIEQTQAGFEVGAFVIDHSDTDEDGNPRLYKSTTNFGDKPLETVENSDFVKGVIECCMESAFENANDEVEE